MWRLFLFWCSLFISCIRSNAELTFNVLDVIPEELKVPGMFRMPWAHHWCLQLITDGSLSGNGQLVTKFCVPDYSTIFQMDDLGQIKAVHVPDTDPMHDLCIGGEGPASTTAVQRLKLETCLDSSDPTSDTHWKIGTHSQLCPISPTIAGYWRGLYLYNIAMDKCAAFQWDDDYQVRGKDCVSALDAHYWVFLYTCTPGTRTVSYVVMRDLSNYVSDVFLNITTDGDLDTCFDLPAGRLVHRLNIYIDHPTTTFDLNVRTNNGNACHRAKLFIPLNRLAVATLQDVECKEQLQYVESPLSHVEGSTCVYQVDHTKFESWRDEVCSMAYLRLRADGPGLKLCEVDISP